MKKVAILFFVIFFAVISIVLVRHTTAQEKVQQFLDVACVAEDLASFKQCLQDVFDKKTDFIKITKVIICENQSDCAFSISGINRAVLIYGVSNTGSGFRRTGELNYSLFTIQNSSKVSIGGMLIDDTNGLCALGNCQPMVLVKDSENILIDGLNTKSALGSAVVVQGSVKTVIKKSVFNDSANHGIEIQNMPDKISSESAIESNTFKNSGTSALVLASFGKNIISGNTFEKNHRSASFSGCGDLCSGAQMVIASPSGSIKIDKNIVRNGSIDVYSPFGLTASGVQISGSDIEQVTLRCNTITANTGNGLVVANRTDSFQKLEVEKNKFIMNGIDVNVVPLSSDVIKNNCFNDSCVLDGC